MIRIKLVVHTPHGIMGQYFSDVPKVPAFEDTIMIDTDDGVKEFVVTQVIGVLDTVPVVHVAPKG